MNGSQKLVLFAGCTFIFISGLFPSWVHLYPGHDSSEDDAGRHFILDKPNGVPISLINYVETTTQPQINMNRLFLEWLLVSATAGVIILFVTETKALKQTRAPFDRRLPGSFLAVLFVIGLYVYWFPMSELGSAPAFLIFTALPMILVLLILLFFDVLLNIVRRGLRWTKVLLLVEGLLMLSFSVWWVIRFLRYMRI
jgi:hypothetical protein